MDFHAAHHKLPEPGGYVSSLPGPPCPECHSAIFDVVLSERRAKKPDQDGVRREWRTVDVECPECSLLSRETVVERRVIGSLNTRTGNLLLA
jgi:hypothetical protein